MKRISIATEELASDPVDKKAAKVATAKNDIRIYYVNAARLFSRGVAQGSEADSRQFDGEGAYYHRIVERFSAISDLLTTTQAFSFQRMLRKGQYEALELRISETWDTHFPETKTKPSEPLTAATSQRVRQLALAANE